MISNGNKVDDIMVCIKSVLSVFFLLVIFLIAPMDAATFSVIVFEKTSNSTLSIPYALVYANNAYLGRTDKDGTLSFTLPGDGPYPVSVVKPGYTTFSGEIDANNMSILVPLTKGDENVSIQLFDADSVTPVSDADVLIRGVNISTMLKSDSNGSVNFFVPGQNSYNIEMSAAGYDPRIEHIDVSVEDQNLQYWLYKEGRSSIIVSDENNRPISGATVINDDQTVGTSNDNGIVVLHLSPGVSYPVKIRKDGFAEKSITLTGSDRHALEKVTLNKAEDQVSILVYNGTHEAVAGAQVSFNGTIAGSTNEFGRLRSTGFYRGTINVSIVHPMYEPVNTEVTFDQGDNEKIFILEPARVSAVLNLMDDNGTIIRDAQVKMNGIEMGFTDNDGNILLMTAKGEPIHVTVNKSGYQPLSTDIPVPGDLNSLNITLKLTKIVKKEVPAPMAIENYTWLLAVPVILIACLIIGLILRRKEHKGHRRGGRDL